MPGYVHRGSRRQVSQEWQSHCFRYIEIGSSAAELRQHLGGEHLVRFGTPPELIVRWIAREELDS